jgi:uncharacterized membrane protein YhaH (DUF805 family)
LFLFTSFQGRISRVEWWTGVVILAVVGLIERWLLGPFTPKHLLSWPHTIWQLAWLIPTAALAVKRFNDRDRPSWVGPMFIAMAAIFHIAPHLGLFILPGARGIGSVLWPIFLVFGLWTFLDNGFGPGTRGPNRYGPDPLASETTTA